MTPGLTTLTELRDALARLVAGEPFAWQRIAGSYDLLRRALVEAVRGNQGIDPTSLLDECWALMSHPETLDRIARFHRHDPHYAGVNVDPVWLNGNTRALVASARTAVAAQQRDVAALTTWAAIAGGLHGCAGGPAVSPSNDVPTSQPEDLIDLAFDSLTRAGWRVEGARVWTLAWLPRTTGGQDRRGWAGGRRHRRRKKDILNGPAVRVPAAGCLDGKGFLADLCLYRLAGEGELVPHPETALQPLGSQLLGSLRSAWEPSRQSVCFTFGVHDASVPSWVPLEGASLSGAASLAFQLLERSRSGDARRLIVAQALADGTLEPVGHEAEKLQAALERGVPSVVLAEDSQVPETCVERFRASGQEVVRARSMSEVLDLPPVQAPSVPKRSRVPTRVMAAVVLLLAALGGSSILAGFHAEGRCLRSSSPDISLVVAAVWSDNEQTAFQSVLEEFCDRTGIRVGYNQAPTSDMAQYLEDRRCQPPDLAMLAQPGLMRELARTGRLQPLGHEAVSALVENYSEEATAVGAVDDTQYGVYFKASNKSVWWFNAHEFSTKGIQPPATWEAMLAEAEASADDGKPWLAMGGADPWTLTDLFENIYLRTAGVEKYDQLMEHLIPWDDQSVVEALTVLGQLIGDDRFLAGGREGALKTKWQSAVLQVLGPDPTALTTFEGDFIIGFARAQSQGPPGIDLFEFPSIAGSAPAVIGGGDIAVALTDNPAAQKVLAFLATPEAASVWARRAGFTSPNQRVSATAYPDDLTQRLANALSSSDRFRFDLSDQQPPSFGARYDQGMWLRFQEFLRNPDPWVTARALEADASRSYADLSHEASGACASPSRGSREPGSGG